MIDSADRTWRDKFSWAESNLRVVSQTYGQAIAEGDISGHAKWKTVGFREDLSTTESWIAPGATGRYPWPAAAITMYVVSTDADDDDGDTGARTVQIQGVIAAGTVATETVTMDGTTRVATANQYLALVIDNCKVLTAGTSNANEGTLQVYDAAAAGNLLAVAGVGTNQFSGSTFLVPTGMTAYFLKISVGEASNQGAIFRLYQKGPSDGVFIRRDVWLARNNTTIDEFLIPTMYAAGTRLEVTGDAAVGTAIVSVKFLGWIE